MKGAFGDVGQVNNVREENDLKKEVKGREAVGGGEGGLGWLLLLCLM